MPSEEPPSSRFPVDLLCFSAVVIVAWRPAFEPIPALMFANAEFHQTGPNYSSNMHNVLLCLYTSSSRSRKCTYVKEKGSALPADFPPALTDCVPIRTAAIFVIVKWLKGLNVTVGGNHAVFWIQLAAATVSCQYIAINMQNHCNYKWTDQLYCFLIIKNNCINIIDGL